MTKIRWWGLLAIESGPETQYEVETRGVTVKRRIVSKEAIRRFAVRSTRESAKLEGRAVPVGHVRSERVHRFLAERRQRA